MQNTLYWETKENYEKIVLRVFFIFLGTKTLNRKNITIYEETSLLLPPQKKVNFDCFFLHS